MSKHRWFARAVWGLLFAVLFGCTTKPKQPEPAELGRSWRSRHFVYHSRPDDDSVCPGILETLEAHYAALHGALQLDGAGQVIHYYKFRDARDLERDGHCSATSSSCFFSSLGIETSHAFERHELVHAYLAPLGDSHKLLEEGVAQALSCGNELRAPVKVPWQDAFSSKHWREASVAELRELYAAGSWFVGYLLREHGARQFLQFYSALDPEDGASRAAASFERVYRSALAGVWQRALAADRPELACVYAFECATANDAASRSSRAACDGSGTFRSLSFAADRWVSEQGSHRSMRLTRCADSPALPHLAGADPWVGQVHGERFYYAPGEGRYFYQPAAERGALDLHSLTTRVGHAEDCAALSPWTSDGERSLLFALSRDVWQPLQGTTSGARGTDSVPVGAVRPAPAKPAWVLRWHDHRLSRSYMYRVECARGLTLQACESCSAACETICDRDVRVSTFYVKQDVAFHGFMSEPADTWFRLHRVDR